MLHKGISRVLTRRNLTFAVWRSRASSSAGVEDENAGRWLCPRDRRSLVFRSHGKLSSEAEKCLRAHERRSHYIGGFLERRRFSSAIAEEASDLTSADSPSEALQRYLKVIQVCEILEAHPWGPETRTQLQNLDVSFASDMVVRVIRASSSPASSLDLFDWLTLQGFEHDTLTYGTMMDMLGEAGCIDDMKRLTEEMRSRGLVLDVDMYDRLIHWCANHGDAMGASSFLERMKEEGIAMSASTYTSLFELHVKEAKYEEAVTLYLQMIEDGLLPISETLIRCLLDAGKLESAQEIFTSLSNLKVKHPISVFAHLMAAHAKVGNKTLLHTLGKELQNLYDRPGKVFCIALSSLQKEGKLEEAEAFAKEVWPELSVEERRVKAQDLGIMSILNERDETELKDDIEQLVCADKKVRVSLSETARLLETEGFSVLEQVKVDWTADVVYKILRQFKRTDVAWEFFKWLKSTPRYTHDMKNDVLMLRMLIKSLNFVAFKELLSELQSKRRDMPLEVFNILIKDCAYAKNAKAAMWVYSRMKDSSLQPDEETFTSLVHAFARGRNPDKASDLCSVMQDVGIKPDAETYTAVIHSLGLSGRSDDAWSFYQKMCAVGLKPNVNTYTALLNVMNLVGDTGFAIKLYKEMNDNGVASTEATQGLMARIWETTGNSTEAQKLETQRKFLSSKRREESLHHIYEVLLEGLVEQERSPSLSCLSG